MCRCAMSDIIIGLTLMDSLQESVIFNNVHLKQQKAKVAKDASHWHLCDVMLVVI